MDVIRILLGYIKKLLVLLEDGEKEQILEEINEITMEEVETKQKQLLRVAKNNLGRDVTPTDKVPDEVACAENVSWVIQQVDATFPMIWGTWTLEDRLKRDGRFKGTLDVDPGNIVVCATGTGNGSIRGHTGIILEDGRIAANNSNTGNWEITYNWETWNARYKKRGGFKNRVFKMI